VPPRSEKVEATIEIWPPNIHVSIDILGVIDSTLGMSARPQSYLFFSADVNLWSPPFLQP
jgi:hypothetical protein